MFGVVRQDGMTLLMSACYHGYWDVVQVLIDIGADVNDEDIVSFENLHDFHGYKMCPV